MRTTHRLGFVVSIAALGCSPKQTVATRMPLPDQADLGGATLFVDRDGVALRLTDGPHARVTLVSSGGEPVTLRPTSMSRDAGALRVALEGQPPLVITRGDAGSVAVSAPDGAHVSLAVVGAFAFAPGSHLGDTRARDVAWGLVETAGRAIAVGPSRARVDGSTLTATGPRVALSWGAPSAIGKELARAPLVARFEPAAAGHVALFDAEGRAIGVGLSAADGVLTSFSLGPPRQLVALVGGRPTGAPISLGADPVIVPAPRHAHLDVRVVDPDVGAQLPCRVVVRGVAGTPDPTFGSPERAMGAGPIFDTDGGAVSAVVTPGQYKVFATRGVEYSADSADVTLREGVATSVELKLRRVVPTPGWISADLHVHSRGSFDSLVSLDDRVRSLVAAGVDFAAATEHNRVGSYESAVFPSARGFAWTAAVEVTTVNPLRGHFNVIPWSDPDVPRYQQTTLGRLIDDVKRRSPASLVQINHPRLDGRIGYFHAMHADPTTDKGRRMIPRGFHAIEVYNGFDLGQPAHVDDVLRDYLALLEAGFHVAATGNSDSHTVQYVGAGYPRTYVRTDEPVAVQRVVDALKEGRALATSGPVVWVSQGDRTHGDVVERVGDHAKVRVVVKATTWISLRSIEVWAGGDKVWSRPLVRAASFNAPEGALADAERAAVALDEEVDLAVKPGARAIVVVVRGGPGVGEPLGVVDFSPLAITSPVWLSPDPR